MVDTDIDASNIENFKAYRSQIFGRANIYSFVYKSKQYYVTDDYSLMDNSKFVTDVLSEVAPKLNGKLLKNPIAQSDGAIYACGVDGTEYYLWRALLK
ncbi:MAG TPA: hypothetical protein PKD20_03320 [Candidatus Saccharibacteria bacterium]|nr:hypothetical protein [Candidatus Saccharibacteria bacterium]